MGISPVPKGSRTGVAKESLPVCNEAPSSPKRRWSKLMPLVVAFVVIAQIMFLGRLDIAKDTALVDSWADFFYRSSAPHELLGKTETSEFPKRGPSRKFESGSCQELLEREDAVPYSRDFEQDPIFIYAQEKGWKKCAVGCKFGLGHAEEADAQFGLSRQKARASVLRSMESSKYYEEIKIDIARRAADWLLSNRRGYDVVMTTSLSSDVPVGYFSWVEYDIMAPVLPKNESALAAAFISNCAARNFRLQALEALEKAKIKIDSYGSCHRNHNERVNKVQTLKHYKFSLAFENSNEEDYVTEKFFQSLVAGTIPVVVGAPNIQDFAPSHDSILHLNELGDAEFVAQKMKYLAENPDAYNQSLRWKYEGPSDSFKALVDMSSVHSSCRLCIHLATRIREKEELSPQFKKRPCKCTRGSETVYHLYARERGRFQMESIFLRSGNMTLKALESAVLAKFRSLQHVPVWKEERPKIIRGGDELKVYRIYPVGLTQRQALYTFRFKGDDDLRSHVEKNLCAKFEVIFV